MKDQQGDPELTEHAPAGGCQHGAIDDQQQRHLLEDDQCRHAADHEQRNSCRNQGNAAPGARSVARRKPVLALPHEESRQHGDEWPVAILFPCRPGVQHFADRDLEARANRNCDQGENNPSRHGQAEGFLAC
jgi:hypothetical protein